MSKGFLFALATIVHDRGTFVTEEIYNFFRILVNQQSGRKFPTTETEEKLSRKLW